MINFVRDQLKEWLGDVLQRRIAAHHAAQRALELLLKLFLLKLHRFHLPRSFRQCCNLHKICDVVNVRGPYTVF